MIRILPDHESLSRAAAEYIRSAGKRAIRRRGRFDLALSGGGTPARAFEILAGLMVEDPSLRDATHFYWSDERCAPLDDPRSNYALAKRTLLDPAGVPAVNIHRIEACGPDRAAEAERYDREFPARADLVMLGVGTEGHTASLFPGSPLLQEHTKRFAPADSLLEPRLRITMTPAGLASARRVLVLVSGDSKPVALMRVFVDEGDVDRTPARLVRDADWLIDEAAAREFKSAGARRTKDST